MSLLVLLPSRFTPGSLPGEFQSSSNVLLSHSGGTPGSILQSCLLLNSCPVMSLLELLLCHVTPRALVQSSHFISSCPVMSILELLLSHLTR